MPEPDRATSVARKPLNFGASEAKRATWPAPNSLQTGERVVCTLGGSVIYGVLLGINTYACWATVQPDGSRGHTQIEPPWRIVSEQARASLVEPSSTSPGGDEGV